MGIAQGIFEGLLFGVFFSLIFTAGIGLFPKVPHRFPSQSLNSCSSWELRSLAGAWEVWQEWGSRR